MEFQVRLIDLDCLWGTGLDSQAMHQMQSCSLMGSDFVVVVLPLFLNSAPGTSLVALANSVAVTLFSVLYH